MATEEQCQEALQALADRLAENNAGRNDGFNRTLSCTLRDLGVIYRGRLSNGQLLDIATAESRDADVKLTMSSDDLLALVNGELKMASAWASGRVKVDAGVRDMLKLRSIF